MIEVGSRWYLWGFPRIIVDRRRREERTGHVLNRQTGEYEVPWMVCAVPEERAEKKPHWTDWMLEEVCEKKGTPLLDGQDTPPVKRPVVPAKTQREAAERAVEEVRAESTKKEVTPLRRAQNKVTSTRYKINHPEKTGKEKWSKDELAELHTTLDAAMKAVEAERKGGKK